MTMFVTALELSRTKGPLSEEQLQQLAVHTVKILGVKTKTPNDGLLTGLATGAQICAGRLPKGDVTATLKRLLMQALNNQESAYAGEATTSRRPIDRNTRSAP